MSYDQKRSEHKSTKRTVYIPYRILCFEMFPYRGRCTNRSFHLVTNTAKNKDCEILFSIVDRSFLNTIFELKSTIE